MYNASDLVTKSTKVVIIKLLKVQNSRGLGATLLTWTIIALTLIKLALQNQNPLSTKYSSSCSKLFLKSTDFYTHIFMVNTKPLCCLSICDFLLFLCIRSDLNIPFCGPTFLKEIMVWWNFNLHNLCFHISFSFFAEMISRGF